MPGGETIQIGLAIIGLIQAIAVAIVGGLFARESRARKKHVDKTEARAALRAEESRLSMKLMLADVALTLATACAVKEGRVNGKMEAALALAEIAQKEYYDFINAVAVKQITK